ncbi:MAG: cytochrome c oxidase assembly protein [Acidimicrobiales bacterium]
MLAYANPLTALGVFTKASFDPAPVILIAITLGWYLWSVRRLARRGRRWPLARTASFCTAELLLAVATLSGVSAFDDISFTDHVIQHILIGMVAPVFLALSAPVTLALQASSRPVQTTILKVVHSPVGKTLSNPAFTWGIYGLSLFAYYFTSLYAYSLHHPVFHELVHLHMLLAGSLLIWPAIGIDPLPKRMSHGMRMLYLLLALPFHTILGMALESQSSTIAAGITLGDIHTGGALMWVSGEALGLICTIAIFMQWLRVDERAARRADRVGEASAARQMAHWRATRDAAARAMPR